jgi:hypothetical protein
MWCGIDVPLPFQKDHHLAVELDKAEQVEANSSHMSPYSKEQVGWRVVADLRQ